MTKMHTVLLQLFSTKPRRRNYDTKLETSTVKGISSDDREGHLVTSCYTVFLSYMKRLSFLGVGPSLAGSSEILMASSMAANSPAPPSPLRAGPKHSGLRIRRRTTTLAFSSTLSPTEEATAEIPLTNGYGSAHSIIFPLQRTNGHSIICIYLTSLKLLGELCVTLHKVS